MNQEKYPARCGVVALYIHLLVRPSSAFYTNLMYKTKIPFTPFHATTKETNILSVQDFIRGRTKINYGSEFSIQDFQERVLSVRGTPKVLDLQKSNYIINESILSDKEKLNNTRQCSELYFADIIGETRRNENDADRLSTKSLSQKPKSGISLSSVPRSENDQVQMSYVANEKRIMLDNAMKAYLSSREREDVMKAIQLASAKYQQESNEAIEFCRILVNSMGMGRNCLIAAAFHFCSCMSIRDHQWKGFWSSITNHDNEGGELIDPEMTTHFLCSLVGCGIEEFGPKEFQIASDAAKLKGIETIASVIVNGETSYVSPDMSSADNLRSLLLSMNANGDWRALTIRLAASLYRLRRCELQCRRSLNNSSIEHIEKRSECVKEAREVLRIYAPLAHQLGMYRLKSELERTAFRSLYPRQHSTVLALYRTIGGKNSQVLNTKVDDESVYIFDEDEAINMSGGMQDVLQELTTQLKRRLMDDYEFMEHIESVSITARVKQLYSLWCKLLKIRAKTGRKSLSDLSVLQASDAVALRVVLKAKKLESSESDEVTRAREIDLCYFVIQKCMDHDHWSSSNNNKVKDYIAKPKENGYQSLHYLAQVRWHGDDIPFEVQVRTSEMHRVAEYGLASHWNYKMRKDGRSQGRQQVTPIEAWRSLEHHHVWNTKLSTPSLSMLPERVDDNFQKQQQYQQKRLMRQRLTPYIEALLTRRMVLARERVFIFFSPQHGNRGGTILSLPIGASVLDALRDAEERMLFDCKNRNETILRNSKHVTAMETLQNGDILSIKLVGSV